MANPNHFNVKCCKCNGRIRGDKRHCKDSAFLCMKCGAHVNVNPDTLKVSA